MCICSRTLGVADTCPLPVQPSSPGVCCGLSPWSRAGHMTSTERSCTQHKDVLCKSRLAPGTSFLLLILFEKDVRLFPRKDVSTQTSQTARERRERL